MLALVALAPSAWAQTFPKPDDSGVVDTANLLDAAQEQVLSQKLIALKRANGRSLVVATIPDLQGYEISDYGYRLLRAWGVGSKELNDGVILLVAPNDRKVWIVTGYGIEGIVTDALSSQITRNDIIPRFKADDFPGGIEAGVDALAKLLALPPDEAKAQAAKAEAQNRASNDQGGGVLALWIGLFVLFFLVIPLLSRTKGSRHYRRGRGPVIIWGPGSDHSDWGSNNSWGSGSSWGDGGDSGGGFFGGGSSGGGGAGGSW